MVWTNPWLLGTWEQSDTFLSNTLDRKLTKRLLEKKMDVQSSSLCMPLMGEVRTSGRQAGLARVVSW